MRTAVSPPACAKDSLNVAVPLACDRAQERDEQQRRDDDGHRRGDDDDDSRVLHGGRVVRRLGKELQRRGVDDVVQRVAGDDVVENGLRRELHSGVKTVGYRGLDFPMGTTPHSSKATLPIFRRPVDPPSSTAHTCTSGFDVVMFASCVVAMASAAAVSNTVASISVTVSVPDGRSRVTYGRKEDGGKHVPLRAGHAHASTRDF